MLEIGYNNVDKRDRCTNVQSYEQLGSCAGFIEAHMEFFATEHGICTRTHIVKGTHCCQACDKFFRPPNSTTQEKVVASRSDCEHESQEFIVDSGASLHMMIKYGFTSGENGTIRRSHGSAVITTASGKAELTQEATLYVNDLDVFVAMMLLEDSPAVLSSGLLCEDMGFSCEWKKGRGSIIG